MYVNHVELGKAYLLQNQALVVSHLNCSHTFRSDTNVNNWHNPNEFLAELYQAEFLHYLHGAVSLSEIHNNNLIQFQTKKPDNPGCLWSDRLVVAAFVDTIISVWALTFLRTKVHQFEKCRDKYHKKTLYDVRIMNYIFHRGIFFHPQIYTEISSMSVKFYAIYTKLEAILWISNWVVFIFIYDDWKLPYIWWDYGMCWCNGNKSGANKFEILFFIDTIKIHGANSDKLTISWLNYTVIICHLLETEDPCVDIPTIIFWRCKMECIGSTVIQFAHGRYINNNVEESGNRSLNRDEFHNKPIVSIE